MRVGVVGAGIIGITTAWELALDGHEVTVYEQRDSVAAETSFANAGVIAPGYVTPWSAPGMAGKVLGQLLSRHAAVRLRRGIGVATLRWLWRWWRSCDPRIYAANRERMQRLAIFSRDRLHALTQQLRLDYERADGYLVLLRGAREAALVEPGLEVLSQVGTPFQLLDAEQCRRIEPALSETTPLRGGVYLPNDEVGNCRQFAQLLRQESLKKGVAYTFNSRVLSIEAGRQPVLRYLRSAPPFDGPAARADRGAAMVQAATFDAVVVCAAIGSGALLAPLGVRLPLLPVWGYSLTAPLRRVDGMPLFGPRAAVMDERFKVAISRLGRRVRVAGSAEIGGRAETFDAAAVDTLHRVLQDWYPGCANLRRVQRWKGARPMLPDGPPVIGASPAPGVWLNVGHGSGGWALACGSARLVADALARRPPSVAIDGLGFERIAAA